MSVLLLSVSSVSLEQYQNMKHPPSCRCSAWGCLALCILTMVSLLYFYSSFCLGLILSVKRNGAKGHVFSVLLQKFELPGHGPCFLRSIWPQNLNISTQLVNVWFAVLSLIENEKSVDSHLMVVATITEIYYIFFLAFKISMVASYVCSSGLCSLESSK